MIHNRTDFYFSDNTQKWDSSTMPRLIAVVDAWLASSVKIYREGFELMMALSRCRGINTQFTTLAMRQIERYLKTILKHNRELERSWHRDPANPQPGPVFVAEFPSSSLDEDGVPVLHASHPSSDGSVIVGSSDEEILSLVCRHYQQMYAALSADPRAHLDDIARAASLSLLEPAEPAAPHLEEPPTLEDSSVSVLPPASEESSVPTPPPDDALVPSEPTVAQPHRRRNS